MNRLKKYFITGLVGIIPIFLTVYVLIVAFRFIDGILGRFLNIYLKQILGFYVPGLGILIFLIIITLVGFLATHFIGKRIFPRIERRFSGLPLIKNIYPAFKQIVLFILAQREFGFKKVVLVEYPSKGIWSLGFLTNEKFERANRITGKEMAGVFIPSTPGPLTGYLIFVPKEELKFPDISITDALKLIISGGVFNP